MRRDGVKYGIRSNQTLKYCRMCLDNVHCDQDRKIFGNYTSALVDTVIIGRLTKKPLFACRHSHGCKMCSHSHKPYDKALKKAKGNRKEGNKHHKDVSDMEILRF